MVTLKDIAERAGVSMMTVSRVMNSKEGKVSEKTASEFVLLRMKWDIFPIRPQEVWLLNLLR